MSEDSYLIFQFCISVAGRPSVAILQKSSVLSCLQFTNYSVILIIIVRSVVASYIAIGLHESAFSSINVVLK